MRWASGTWPLRTRGGTSRLACECPYFLWGTLDSPIWSVLFVIGSLLGEGEETEGHCLKSSTVPSTSYPSASASWQRGDSSAGHQKIWEERERICQDVGYFLGGFFGTDYRGHKIKQSSRYCRSAGTIPEWCATRQRLSADLVR